VERRVKVVTNGSSLSPRLDAIVLSNLEDNLGARKTNIDELRPSGVLRIEAKFDSAPVGGCPSSVAKVATITYQLETIPESGAPGVRLAPRESKGVACYGNDDEDTSISAIGKALASLNRDSILSLFKEIQ
jgi:hypothetical protein